MKFVIAIIQPDKLEDVLEELEKKQIHLVTVSTVLGRGRQKGVSEIYRSHREGGSLLKKIKLEIAVNDDYVSSVKEAIRSGARTGNIGDGKIFVLNMEDCMRIRTGESGSEAIG